MKKLILVSLACLMAVLPLQAQTYNLKVVTDASPDYTDMDSMVRSVTAKWPTMQEKCWAIFYWVHIGRRQTAPMILHSIELADPIRQFNDYGYAMCSTVSGVNCAIWGQMGLKSRFWDIGNHTVSECFYDGRWHIYDDSMSALYTLCDGKTIAGVQDVGQEGSCEASGGKTEKFHLAKYHCLTATSDNGFITGSDDARSLNDEGNCFRPNVLQYRYYISGHETGHRYVLNLRDGDQYTRYYHRLDAPMVEAGTGKVVQGKFVNAATGQPVETAACYTPNYGEHPEQAPFDPERGFNIRGNGRWISRPSLTAEGYKKALYSESNIAPATGGGLQRGQARVPAEVVFLVQSANVTTSMSVDAKVFRKTADDLVKFSFSTDEGVTWQPLTSAAASQPAAAGEADIHLDLPSSVKPDLATQFDVKNNTSPGVNGAYRTLVKVELDPKDRPADAVLKAIELRTITQVNAKTQPRLNIGKNTVYVGAGEQTGSIFLWPNIGGDKYKDSSLVDEKNITTGWPNNVGKWIYYGNLHPTDGKQEAYVVYRITAPNDLTKVVYGGRFSSRYEKEHIDLSYSLDDGKTWTQSWSLTNNDRPWDTLHHETFEVPAGHKTVLLKYSMFGMGASIYSLIAEGDYKAADAGDKPIEVTFRWNERQADYSLVPRSHTAVVEKLPARYTINVGGADHPVMESLTVNLKGSSPSTQPAKAGYSDGKDVGGEKYVGRWQTVGKVLTVGKPYTLSSPSTHDFGASEDKDNKILTDGVVGSWMAGGPAPRCGMSWTDKVGTGEITVDLGKAEKCGAFRIHLTAGWPQPDALRGQFKDKVEVLTSADGKDYTSAGVFPMDLRFKDVPWNYMLPDCEELRGCNFELLAPKPVEARYVKYKVTPSAGHALVITEVQALDKIEYRPFDIGIALPDEKVPESKIDPATLKPAKIEP